LHAQNARLGKNLPGLGETHYSSTRKPKSHPAKNAFDYGAGVSASAIYAYVNNDPLNRVDPTGLAAEQNQSTGNYDLFGTATGPAASTGAATGPSTTTGVPNGAGVQFASAAGTLRGAALGSDIGEAVGGLLGAFCGPGVAICEAGTLTTGAAAGAAIGGMLGDILTNDKNKGSAPVVPCPGLGQECGAPVRPPGINPEYPNICTDCLIKNNKWPKPGAPIPEGLE
jgi:hypothetical protein